MSAYDEPRQCILCYTIAALGATRCEGCSAGATWLQPLPARDTLEAVRRRVDAIATRARRAVAQARLWRLHDTARGEDRAALSGSPPTCTRCSASSGPSIRITTPSRHTSAAASSTRSVVGTGRAWGAGARTGASPRRPARTATPPASSCAAGAEQWRIGSCRARHRRSTHTNRAGTPATAQSAGRWRRTAGGSSRARGPVGRRGRTAAPA